MERVYTTWMRQEDIRAVHRIDVQSHARPMSSSQFQLWVDSDVESGLVVRNGSDIVGYCVFGVQATNYRILRLAVAPAHRRNGYGRLLIDSIKSRLTDRRHRLWTTVSECNLDGHLFLRSLGFRATKTVPKSLDNRKEPGYWFVYYAPTDEEKQIQGPD